MPTGTPHGRPGRDRNRVSPLRRFFARRYRRGNHRQQRPATSAFRRAVHVGALIVVAAGLLTAGGDVVLHRMADSAPVTTRAVAPADLADRTADNRASRRDRSEERRTGTVPSPNSATKPKPSPPKPKPKPKPKPAWVVPTSNYTVTSGFGPRWGTMHNGVDLAGPTGTPIVAIHSGTVTKAEWYGGYGYAVIIDHGNGVSTLYGHNSRLLVRAGQRVHTGQRISLRGSTGDSTGPHLHFEVHLGDNPVDPVPWLRQRGVRL